MDTAIRLKLAKKIRELGKKRPNSRAVVRVV